MVPSAPWSPPADFGSFSHDPRKEPDFDWEELLADLQTHLDCALDILPSNYVSEVLEEYEKGALSILYSCQRRSVMRSIQ